MNLNLVAMYGASAGNSPWDGLTADPRLTFVDDEGSRHTVAQDFGPHDGWWTSGQNDTGGRVYVYGYPHEDAIDVALKTPVARGGCWVTGDILDGDVAPAPHYEFGRSYLVADEDREADREYHTTTTDGSVYDLNTGYGPVWADHHPPAGALACLICAYLAHEMEVEIEDLGQGTAVRIGGLKFTAPRLHLGEHTVQTVGALIARLTAEVHEFDSVDHYPHRAKYPPVWLLLHPTYGFWAWFRRALAAYGFDDFVVRSTSNTLTFYSDGTTCSGQED